jgi:hypothetical protein
MSSVSRGPWIARGAALAIVAAAAPVRADIDLNLYGDIDGGIQTTGSRAGTADGFSAAKLDLFTTSTAGRWSFLAETMFEAGGENSFELDVERIQIGYLFGEHLRVSAGRFHTALGYYNDAFHHGAYFMVPVGRPTMVEFEDGGGLIPAHNIGIHADGRFALGDGHLRYDVELANGRAADPLAIQNDHDGNRPKAINLRLRYEPGGALDGLLVGGNLYFDGIPRRTGVTTEMTTGMTEGGPPPLGPIHEWIVGAHAAYLEHDLHLIAEAIAVQHTELDTGAQHRSYAAFAEAGRVYDQVIPYARYEWTRFPSEGDPYYQRTAGDGYQAVSVGVKHTTSDNVALKAQAGVAFPAASGADPMVTLTGQVAFAF